MRTRRSPRNQESMLHIVSGIKDKQALIMNNAKQRERIAELEAQNAALLDRIARMEARLREQDEFVARCHDIIGEEPNGAHTLDQRIAALAQRVTELEAALDAAQDDAARLRAVILKSPEWVYNRNEDDGWCVHCKRWYTEGHAPDCQRQIALAQTSEVKA